MAEKAHWSVRYGQLRREVHRRILERVTNVVPALTGLTDIDAPTLEAWDKQWKPHLVQSAPGGTWNWRDEATWWSRRHVDRFEVAIWSDTTLCGLAVGRPSPKRNNISLYMVQGAPAVAHPLKGQVFAIALANFEAYGDILGCREVRLIMPLPGVVNWYRAMRFAPVSWKNRLVYMRRSLP